MLFKHNVIQGETIDDVWRDAMWCCVRNGKDYRVEQGSYVGQLRRQLPYTLLVIEKPWKRPLAVRTPEGSNISAPTNEDRIVDYFMHYLISNIKAENEDYTYGEFIVTQLQAAIDKLINSNGNTNQAAMSIGNEESIFLDDPPCLREIHFKVYPNDDGTRYLQMAVDFRSWDLYTGLPENLGGLQMLKEYVLGFLQDHFQVQDGPIIAFSDGLHIYEQYFGLVNSLCVDKII